MMGKGVLEMSSFRAPGLETPTHPNAPILQSDPHRKRAAGQDGFEGASVWSGVANLSTSIIGAGIMGLAATMKVLGLPLGILFLVGMAFLTELSLAFLVRTTTVQHTWTYSDLVKQEFGNWSRFVLDISVVINNLGICTIYLIIIADVLSGTFSGNGYHHTGLLVEWNGGVAEWWNSRYFVIFITMLVFLAPLTALKHVDSLHYTSALSVALALVFVVITVIVAIIGLAKKELPAPSFGPDLSNTAGVVAIFTVIPVMATAYICHFNVHPIYIELKERNEETMLKVTRYSIILTTTVYFFTAIAGYLLFGSDVDSDLLVNFDQNLSWLGNSTAVFDVVRVSYVLHIILVFPVIFYSLRNITDDLLFPNAAKELLEDNRRFYGITAVYLLLVYLFSVLIPNVWMAFTITGATTTMVVGMLFPALLALRDQSGTFGKWERRTAYFMVGLAAFVSVTGIVCSIWYIANGRAAQPGTTELTPTYSPPPAAALSPGAA